MARYLKKFRSTMALGPTEEREVPLWVGYDIEGASGDLSGAGLVNVDGWSEQQLRDRGVTAFTRVGRDDVAMRGKLGIG